MSMPPRFEPTCPPDAHKVMREPENKVAAKLCVAVEDHELSYGTANICDLLSAFSKTPLISCSDKVREEILKFADASEIKPQFLKNNGDHAVIMPGEAGAEYTVCNLCDPAKATTEFLEALLQKDTVIVIAMPSMYILRSISTVFEWDVLLAKQFLGQYEKASAQLTDSDKELLQRVRYGQEDALKVKELSESAYPFLRLERKLFLQYPTED